MSRTLVHDIVVRTLRLALPTFVVLAMFTHPAFALEDCPGGSTCVYVRNSTQSVISFNVQKYYDSDNEMALGDDYWFPAQSSDLYPGEGAMVLEIDDFQEIFNDTVAAFRGSLSIDGTTLSSLFVLAEVAWATGGVDFSMATHAGDTWHDPDSHRQVTRTFGGTPLQIHARRDGSNVVFTVHDPVGMLGFVPDAAPSASELTIMNFNTYLLLGPSALVAAKPDYCERAEQIISALSRLAVDVVVLNEIASRDILCPVDSYTMVVDHLAGPGRPFPYRSQFLNGTPSEGLLGPTSTGGVVILSKHPVETVHHHEFADGAGEDALMQKGFLHARVTKTVAGQSRVYNVIGTHLQAGGGSSNVAVRRAQRDDIAAYIEGLPANQPILISGDLNTSSGEIPGFLSELDAAHTGFDDIVQYSSAGVQSYYSDSGGSLLDWIVYSVRGRIPASMYWRYLPMRVTHSDHYPAGDLSDHEAVYAYLRFE
jgi:endonuclease/exonuclease/phosphatase family metal-dependent hydrolase